MVGFDNGDMASFHITPEQLNKFRKNLEEHRHKEAKSGDKWATFGPLATIAVDTLYPKGGEWHEGYIDDIYIFGQDGNTSSKLYNKISKCLEGCRGGKKSITRIFIFFFFF